MNMRTRIICGIIAGLLVLGTIAGTVYSLVVML